MAVAPSASLAVSTMEAAAPSCFDMEGLGRPRVTDAHVASFVKEKFGLPITDIKALAGERDLNYRATAGGRPGSCGKF